MPAHMPAKPFDYAPLLRPELPPAAAKWAGFPKYNFVGGHNDAESVPVEGLVQAATAVGSLFTCGSLSIRSLSAVSAVRSSFWP